MVSVMATDSPGLMPQVTMGWMVVPSITWTSSYSASDPEAMDCQ